MVEKCVFRMISLLIFFTLPINSISSTIIESKEQAVSFPNSYYQTLPSTREGEYCGDRICVENQFCNELLVCQCCEGFKSFLDFCIPCARENERCIVTSGCCENLYCIGGVCRKTIPENEFIQFGKMCLAISAIAIATIIIGVLLNLLIKYCKLHHLQSFNRSNMAAEDMNFTHGNSEQYMNQGISLEVEQEKPPSYEECVLSPPRNIFSEPPPPYTISVDVPSMTVPQTNINFLRNSNVSPANRNLTEVPLSVESLECSLSLDSSTSKVIKLKETTSAPET